jgi:hypothetical protein
MIATNLIIYKLNNAYGFCSQRKIGCYKPTPLKMNLALEIRMDQKCNLKTLPSILLLFPM